MPLRRLPVILFLLVNLTVCGQDVIFSQYMENTLAVNPAFAGVSGNLEVFTDYQQERFGGGTQFETIMASYQQPSAKLHGGVGISIFRDAATRGFISRNSLSAIYAYHLRFSRLWNVSAGFQASLLQKSLNTTGMVLPEMIDPVRGAVLPATQNIDPFSHFYFDVQCGFLVYNKSWFFSLAAFHLLEPQESPNNLPETALPRRVDFVMGRVLPVNSHSQTFSEIRTVSWAGVSYQEGMILPRAGFQVVVNQLSAGIGWRGGLSGIPGFFIPSVGVATKNIRITYSYGVFALGRISGEKKYIHEVTLRYVLNKKNLLVVPFTINPTGF